MSEPVPFSSRRPPNAPAERIAPSLLDRLMDMDPDLETDPPVISAETPAGLRAALRRDLELLLNTRCCPTTPPPEYRQLANSLVSLGIEDFFVASLVTEGQRQRFAADLQTRIARFEPRLADLSVSLISDPVPIRRSLRLRIEARYRARPGLPPIVFETNLDPVAGHFSVTESHRG